MATKNRTAGVVTPSKPVLSHYDTCQILTFYFSGFEPSALPQNYIDEAPQDLVTVRQNLVLLRRVVKSLDTGDDMFGVSVCWGLHRMNSCGNR